MAEASADEGTGVFLVRADADDYERTVASPVDLDAHADGPAALDDLDEARLWDVGDGDRDRETFEGMVSGDLLLFYRDDRYVGVGRIGQTFDDDGWFGRTFRDGDDVGGVFTVVDLAPVDVSRAAVHRIFGYSPSYNPGDLARVADDRVENELDAIALAVRQYDEQNS